MKNAIKKMKYAIVGLSLLLGLGLGLGLRADIKYFWLDHPSGRTNPNDPMSPFYSSPTPKGTPVSAATHTFTMTATITMTPTVTQTYSDSPTGTPTFTVTPQQTATDTPTYTPSPTPTPTAGWPIVFDGDGVPLGTNFYSAGGTDGAVQVTSAGNGAGGSNNYADLTLSSSAYSAVGVFSTGFTGGGAPIYQNAGAYTSLSISVSVPGTGGCIVPGVNLRVVVAGITYTTATVDIENYLLGGDQFISPNSGATNTWYTGVIPLTAFYGPNGTQTPSHTFVSSDFAQLIGVEVQPVNYGNTGVFAGEVYLDNIEFVNTGNATAPTAGSNGFSGLFSDFEDGTADNWGGYWSTNADAFTATDCPGYSPPPGSPNLTSVTYAGVTDTAGAAGSSTPCHDGHFAGQLGAFNGSYGTPICSNTNAFPYLNMTANVSSTATVSANLSNNSFITTLPASGATGLEFDLKLGPTDGGQTYGVAIGTTLTASTGNLYFVQIAASSLSAATWTHYKVAFPAAGYTSSTTTIGTTCHTDQGTATELQWNQSQYATFSAFSITGVLQIEVEAILRGVKADLYVDNIQFY